ncbi:MAG TPA: lysylphosphatidylglycerol synthase transmembrane domain-containing protein [Acidimicrobiales bacterium]|nr:lysylphosphatidylglycerol synthase transmembrane domain-containing protein [Acidimicrobiales bacterium]
MAKPKLLFGALILVALVVLAIRVRGDFVSTFRHLSVRRLPWLAAAVGAEILSFLCYAEVQRRLLFAGGARLGRRTMLRLAVAASGLTNLVPGGTAPASGWLVGQYRRHGIPVPLALWAVIAGGFAATVSVLLLLLAGAAIAGLIGIWATVGCAGLLVGATAGLVWCVHHLRTVDDWLGRHGGVAGLRLLRRAIDRTADVMRFRATVSGGTRVFVLSLGNWGLDVVCLVSAFAVLDLPVPWRAVLFAYATAQIAGSLAPVPGGIGFVEGGMIGAFALAGTPTGHAVVATVIYRLITNWGVAGVGSLALLVVNHRRPEEARLHGEAASLADHDGQPEPGMDSED